MRKCDTSNNDPYADVRCNYAECLYLVHYAECHYADCRGKYYDQYYETFFRYNLRH